MTANETTMNRPTAGRRTMRRRLTCATAAALALMTMLSGCEGKVPKTAAPTVKDSEIIDVTVSRERQIRKNILDVLKQADETKDATGLAARVSGPQLQIRTSQLNIAKATNSDISARATIPDKAEQVIIPTNNEWPRVIYTITTTTEDQQAKRLLVLRQESARQNYKLWAMTRLLEDVSLPKFAVADQGNTMGDADDDNLVMTPRQAVERYADVLQNGDKSEYASSFSNDQFRQSLAKQYSDVQVGVARNNGTQQQAFTPVTDQIAVMRSTADGGDLVVAQINCDWTRTMGEGRESRPASDDEKVLFGSTKATSSLVATYVNVVAIYVPLANSKEKATVVAADQQVVSVKAK
ncbi:hypothetical protein F7D09_0416 [Bifidobacterium leontopitheci]|uniref:DUF8094 domain-containing protein n=2 Tax=Bifidobacterium leontopitheci TaxID=2650774 RepID=A0A6I1GHD2_9BIFI|nr:hypothetical protein F7D09_0416 [Bifidobacterium leontopitheci]